MNWDDLDAAIAKVRRRTKICLPLFTD